MDLFLAALAILGVGALISLALSPFPRLLRWFVPLGLFCAWLLSLPACLEALRIRHPAVPEILLPWNIPYGSFHLRVDPLSALFLFLALFLSFLTALYGVGYLKDEEKKKPLGAHWACFYLLTGSMALVATAEIGRA